MLEHQPTRHKMYSIQEIVKEKKEWCEKFNDYPYAYWKNRWKFLCRRLENYSDMARSLQYKKYKSVKEESDT